jgi:RNA polymerase-binding transcription factor DksA
MTLTQAQRAHLERRLQEERTRALVALNRSVAEDAGGTEEERSGDVSEMPTHPADLGTDTIDQEIDSSNETRVSRELAAIDEALDRLVRTPDRFGICQNTGAQIPFERLDIVPWARTCSDADA